MRGKGLDEISTQVVKTDALDRITENVLIAGGKWACVCFSVLTEVAMCVFLIRWLFRVKMVESRRCPLSLIMALVLSKVVSHHAPLDSPLSCLHQHLVAGKYVKRFKLFSDVYVFTSSAKFNSLCVTVFVCVW